MKPAGAAQWRGGGEGAMLPIQAPFIYFSLSFSSAGLEPNQCPPSVAQVLACATDVCCFSLSVLSIFPTLIHPRAYFFFFFRVPRFNLKFREKSSKDSFLSQTAIRSYAVLYLILGLLANFFFLCFLCISSLFRSFWQIVPCLKVRSTGHPFYFFFLVVVVVVPLCKLSVRAALCKRKSLEKMEKKQTSWELSDNRVLCCANWRWRAYYFFVSNRQPGTEMMKMDGLCPPFSFYFEKIFSTFFLNEKELPSIYFSLSFFLFSHQWRFLSTCVLWFFTLLFAFKFHIIFLISFFSCLFSRAYAEKFCIFHGKSSGPEHEDQLFRWQSVESSLQDRSTRRTATCPRSLGEFYSTLLLLVISHIFVCFFSFCGRVIIRFLSLRDLF